jgi:hypothetical protein
VYPFKLKLFWEFGFLDVLLRQSGLYISVSTEKLSIRTNSEFELIIWKIWYTIYNIIVKCVIYQKIIIMGS